MVLHGPFIYINGYPGVGKLTIANELSKLIPNSKVVDNHLLIDPAAAVLDRSDPEYQDLRKTIRQGVLDKIATTKSTKDVTFIFTDQQSSNELGAMVAKEYQDAAFKRGCRFITVVLKCDLKENVRRMEGESRVGATKTKLKDAHVLKKIRDAEDICSFGGPNELKLDVTDLTPEKAAQKINEHWRESCLLPCFSSIILNSTHSQGPLHLVQSSVRRLRPREDVPQRLLPRLEAHAHP